MKKLFILSLLIVTSFAYSYDRFEGRVDIEDKAVRELLLGLTTDLQQLKTYNVQMIDLLSRINQIVQQHRVEEWHQGNDRPFPSGPQADNLLSNP